MEKYHVFAVEIPMKYHMSYSLILILILKQKLSDIILYLLFACVCKNNSQLYQQYYSRNTISLKSEKKKKSKKKNYKSMHILLTVLNYIKKYIYIYIIEKKFHILFHACRISHVLSL